MRAVRECPVLERGNEKKIQKSSSEFVCPFSQILHIMNIPNSPLHVAMIICVALKFILYNGFFFSLFNLSVFFFLNAVGIHSNNAPKYKTTKLFYSSFDIGILCSIWSYASLFLQIEGCSICAVICARFVVLLIWQFWNSKPYFWPSLIFGKVINILWLIVNWCADEHFWLRRNLCAAQQTL